jgi:hypothetical protein
MAERGVWLQQLLTEQQERARLHRSAAGAQGPALTSAWKHRVRNAALSPRHTTGDISAVIHVPHRQQVAPPCDQTV